MIIDSTFKCTQETFNKATSRSLILLTCIECDKDYMRIKKEILNTFTKYGTKPKFCSKSCLGKNKKKSIETSCNNCNKTINKVLNQYNSSKNHFCSRSCSATWNNKNKTHGTRRSRLEVYLENELTKLYPNLKIEYSGKTAIGSEIDIYIPSLKLTSLSPTPKINFDILVSKALRILIRLVNHYSIQDKQQHKISLH